MKILITGVHGFVGSNLVEALMKEHTIYGLDIVRPMKEGVRYTFSWDDLGKGDMIPDVDAIIHLAGKAHDTKNEAAADVYFKVNTELTKKVFDYFLKQLLHSGLHYVQMTGIGLFHNLCVDINTNNFNATLGSYYCCGKAYIAQSHETSFHITLFY